MKDRTLDSITHREVITVTPVTPLDEVLALMEGAHISCVLTVDAERRPSGIFTEQDAVRLVAEGRAVDGLTMADVMSHPVFGVSGDTDIGLAYHLMSERRMRHLAVVDPIGVLTGVVSETDFVRHIGF